MELKNYLSKELRNKSISLSSLGSENYFVWSKADVQSVIKELTSQGIAILGGDVLKKSNNNTFNYTYDNWYVDKQSHVSWEEFVKHSGEFSLSYILTYPQIEDSELVFNLVTANEDEYASIVKSRAHL